MSTILCRGCRVTFKFHYYEKNKQVSHTKQETICIILTQSSPNPSAPLPPPKKKI